MKRDVSLISKRLSAAFILAASFLFQIPIQQAQAVNDMSGPCVIGSSASCPAQSPQEIYNLYGTTTNSVYWLNVNGTATQTYVILDTSYPDSGGWFLGMKGTKSGNTFIYSSSYWSDQNSTLVPDYNNDVASEAKYNAFNYLPVTKLVAVFKDRDNYAFNSSGSGDLGTNSFGGHTWQENVTSTTMLNRFNTNANVVAASGTWNRYSIYRETNASNGKLVFPYQTGYYQYGYYNSSGQSYRWGVTFNNESNQGSNDSVSGIGLANNNAAGILSYSDNLSYTVNGSSGANNGGSQTLPSGFQIWGKMAAPSLATPGAITLSNQGNGNVQLSFAATSGATEYAIQYKTAGSNWNTSTTYRLTSPSATPTAVIPGVSSGSYDFRVFARATNDSSAGNSYLLAQSIDATAPTVSSISVTSSPGADSIYGLGETITISVTWSESVTVTGSPRIPLQGLTSKYATYSSGSGTSTTLFTYVVTSGDLDRDGISVTANTLALNSGTIKDSSSNSANLNHGAISASLSLQVDGGAPTLSSATISSDGTELTLTFSETISSTISPYSAFTFMVGTTRDALTSHAVSGSQIKFTLTFAVLSGSSLTIAYADPTAGNDVNALQDEAGNDLASFTATAFTNNSTRASNTTAVMALNPASLTAIYRTSTDIKVTVNTAGKVTFYQSGKVISGCRNIATVGSLSIYAICAWKPSNQTYVNLTSTFTPSASGFVTTSSEPLRILVIRRGGLR